MALLRFLLAALAVISLAWLYLSPDGQALVATLADGHTLRQWLGQLAGLGPLGLILLMALAIVVNPIPSAPIALAAGALFGHGWGTLYVVLGAELGAIVAFGIARFVGREALGKWLGERVNLGLWGDPNRLTALVFVSRLLPFISFDLVSYAAGLTVMSLWRFALATLFGLIPMSFLLAHFGAELAGSELDQALFLMLGLGLLTLLSALWALFRRRR